MPNITRESGRHVAMPGSIPLVPLPAGLSWTFLVSPMGPVGMAASKRGVCRVVLGADPRWALEYFPDRADLGHVLPHGFPGGKTVVAYLNGLHPDLDTVPIDVHGTPFQVDVWRAARAIPSGETRTYGDIAQAIGRPGSARAVGQALGRNPVPLLTPCHRVVASNGALGGFTGGLGYKTHLLALEQGQSLPGPLRAHTHAQTRASTGP